MDKDGETNKTDVDLTALDLKGLQEEYLRLKEICSVKSDIVSIAAHQIRTSLSAMKWIIKLAIFTCCFFKNASPCRSYC